MHVAVRQTDEPTGDATASPKDDVRIRAAGGGHGFVLKINLLLRGDFFDARYDFGMIASTVRDGRAFANFDITVLLLVHRRIIGRVRHVHNQRDVRLQRVRDLTRTEQTHFFHDVGDGENFRFRLLFAFA